MRFLLLGFNHHSTPFELLGRIALSPAYLPRFLQAITHAPCISEAVCLATCNRTEVTCVTDDPEQAKVLILETLARLRGLDIGEIEPHCLVLTGESVIRHLLEVSSGIDSLIVGEVEILGQVRRAFEIAEQLGTARTQLRRLFTHAIRFGRVVRQKTNISRGNVSVASAGVRHVSELLGGLQGRRALVIGTGQVGSKTLQNLRDEGVETVMLVNRNAARTQILAAIEGCTPVTLDDLVDAISQADIVICATGAPHDVLTRDMAEQAYSAMPKPRIYLDLSVPPNIDPAVRTVSGTTLIRLEDLQQVAESNAEVRLGEVDRVRDLLATEVERIALAIRTAPRREIIRDFRNTVEQIRTNHLQRQTQRYDAETLAELDRYSRSLVSAILHNITAGLNSIDTETEEGQRALQLARALLVQSAPDSHSSE
jgi:glutamyl-tRNA reductase